MTNSELKTVLETMNITAYPEACAKATASFSVLSETIKTIQQVLKDDQKRSDLAQLIGNLQKEEKEKLQLTAACHLERIRQQNQSLQSESDPRITKLLEDGVNTLQAKIVACVERINEAIDEIRCAILDEE